MFIRFLATAGILFLLPGCNAPSQQGSTDALWWSPPDWVSHAVIYEVFVSDFSEEGTFQAIIPRLGELKDLGITTLWLMPIHPIGVEGRKGVLGSPYAVMDYYGINPNYGTKNDFKDLVHAVHANGMKIILDVVANHTSPDNAWMDEHSDWYTQGPDGEPTVPISPDGNPTDWTDTVDLNYDSEELRAEMINMLRYWIEEFDIDGYRCDVATWVPYDFWKDAIVALREIKPILMLAESDDIRIHDSGFDLTYAWPEYDKMKEVWEGAPVSELVQLITHIEDELPDGTGRLRFTTNHDETAWDAPPPAVFGGKIAAKAAYILTSTLPGVPLIYTGQETGIDVNVSFFEQTAYDWTANRDVRTFFEDYFDFFHESSALKGGSLAFLAPEENDIMMFERTSGGERLIVVVNVRNRESSVDVPASLQGTTGADVFTDEIVSFSDALILEPHEYHVVRVQ